MITIKNCNLQLSARGLLLSLFATFFIFYPVDQVHAQKCETTLNNSQTEGTASSSTNVSESRILDPHQYLENLQEKMFKKEVLNKPELRFLYGLPTETFSQGFRKGSLLDLFAERIRHFRDFKWDLARIHDVKLDEVSQDIKDFKTNPLDPNTKTIKVFYGDIHYEPYDKKKNIYGPIQEASEFSASRFKDLIAVHGDAHIDLTNSWDLYSLKYVTGDLTLDKIRKAVGLFQLQHIGGNLNLASLKNSKGLSGLQYVGASFEAWNLREMKDLSQLKYIGGFPSEPRLAERDGWFWDGVGSGYRQR